MGSGPRWTVHSGGPPTDPEGVPGGKGIKGDKPVQQRTPTEALRLAKDEGVEVVDLRFCDLPGLMQHFSMPVHELTEDGFAEGYGFDGSSIRGFQEIQESDMLL